MPIALSPQDPSGRRGLGARGGRSCTPGPASRPKRPRFQLRSDPCSTYRGGQPRSASVGSILEPLLSPLFIFRTLAFGPCPGRRTKRIRSSPQDRCPAPAVAAGSSRPGTAVRESAVPGCAVLEVPVPAAAIAPTPACDPNCWRHSRFPPLCPATGLRAVFSEVSFLVARKRQVAPGPLTLSGRRRKSMVQDYVILSRLACPVANRLAIGMKKQRPFTKSTLLIAGAPGLHRL